MGQHETAISDFSWATELNPVYHKAYLNLALVKIDIQDLEGALKDLNVCIEVKSDYTLAYYHRGTVNEYLNNFTQACEDFTKAQELGMEDIDRTIELVCEPERAANYANILSLKELLRTKHTVCLKGNPVMVGMGLKGGPRNQRDYLNLLRDAQGNPVTYVRQGSCCGYESENSLFGMALADRYEITYRNKKGKKKKVNIYISFYDFEEPMVPVGFFTVGF